MPNSNLFATCAPQHENVTSDALYFILKQYPEYKETFSAAINLCLLGDYEITREVTVGNGNRPDFVLYNKNWIVYLENKPWSYSTIDGQLKSYARQLIEQKRNAQTTHQSHVLCILTTKSNKYGLLYAAAEEEEKGLGKSQDIQKTLEDYYLRGNNYQNKILFSAITWEEVFDRFAQIQTDNPIPKFLLTQLRDYIIPPQPDLTGKALDDQTVLTTYWDNFTPRLKLIQASFKKKCGTYAAMIFHISSRNR